MHWPLLYHGQLDTVDKYELQSLIEDKQIK